MMGGGTEAFPDLGEHCQYHDCNQLDFVAVVLPGARTELIDRTYRSHVCSKADHNSRIVAVCELCSASIEKQADEEDEDILSHHKKSGTCDPSKKKKPRYPVLRCREVLTLSNSSTCKVCNLKVCIRHRFPSDHSCRAADLNIKFSHSIKVF
ncbi:zinc finger AN1 domain-containing stress-associated protein 12-like [Phalaenopsis equestris]|uniref:zinc finger AN1 domain-containing stress-associated protein 12-like n=1 Tax=Phalaenopsis equestris TaxID=78828 RepID=UPI0009E35E1D|nr:zinc finger AN1 domain-containing stress-associated protein 12-like [Phalaenopsis equestris]